MTRFFFDIITGGQSLYDYEGDEFLNPHGACQYAEVIALHLKRSLNDEWIAWSVEVRNAAGQKYLSLPVAAAEQTAA